MNHPIIISRVNRQNTEAVGKIVHFLKQNHLNIDTQVTDFIVLYRNDIIVACGGLEGDIIKCVAISEKLRGQGILLTLVTELINVATEYGHTALFVYTRSANEGLFRQCGFTTLVAIPDRMVLMENSGTRLTRYLQSLATQRKPGKRISAIVMNANPFTCGHLHLVRYAAARADWLHLFMVNEDASLFPFNDRLALARAATQEISNLTIHSGSRYMISRATFPSYFLKEQGLVAGCHAQIDITLFRQYIAPVLGITHRIVGEEPLCPVTARYNQELSHWLSTPVLPFAPVELVEIPRLLYRGEVVSASRVRRLLQQKRFADIVPLVPDATKNYLYHRLNMDVIDLPNLLTETGKL